MLNIILCNLLKSILFFSFISFNVIDYFKTYKLIRPFYEMIKLEEYLRRCIKNSLIKSISFKKENKPKFSIITPILNKGNTLLRYMRSIQNQIFTCIEIIFIDDHSTDDSLKIIDRLKKEDQRIILLKNKQRKGTLISRNLGVLKSKGEFLIFVDPDDLLAENILNYFHELIKKYDFDLIRFNLYMGNYDLNLPEIVHFLKSQPLYKPNIYFHLFFGFGKLLQLDYYITNKLIKRKLFIRALNTINKFYLNQYMIDCEDGLVNFMLYKLSDSLYFTRKIGYYYIVSKKSITHESADFKKRIKSNFLYFRYIFQSTKNNNIEKKIANFIFYSIYNRHSKILINLLMNIQKEHHFYLKIINLYLNNNFIPLSTKIILKNMRNAILNRNI